jgi:serine/threonine protein kinase
MHRRLGSGSTGETFLATLLAEKRPVAVKVIRKGRLPPRALERAYREVSFLHQLKHPHICKLIGKVDTPHHLCLVMEHYNGGDLCNLVNSKGKMTEDTARLYFRQLIQAVSYLHINNVLHRDIKLENIFLNKDKKEIVLGDFGLATKWVPSIPTTEYVGSVNYAAPEVIRREPVVGPPSDVWSCGVVLYTLVTGQLPFEHDVQSKLVRRIVFGRYKHPRSAPVSAPLRNLIQRMLTPDPAARITLSEILQHPWIASPSSGSRQNNPLYASQQISTRLENNLKRAERRRSLERKLSYEL